MKRIVLALLALAAFVSPAAAQSPCPYIVYGAVLTPAQWQFCFQMKQDALSFTPLQPSQVVGAPPLQSTIGSGVVTLSLNFNSSLVLDGSNNLGINLGHSNTFTVSQTIPTLFGGSATNSVLNLEATSNVSPSGEQINILAATVNVNANHGGASILILGTSGSGAELELYSLNGSGPQIWSVPNGGTGNISFPVSSTALAGLAITQTWTGNNTYNTPIIFTGGVGVPSVNTGQIGASSDGLRLIGNGSGFDIILLTRGGTEACGLASNTSIFECVVNPGANTTASSFIAFNGNAAAAGLQQFSSAFDFVGQGWKTNATAASQQAEFEINEQPIQGAAAPFSTLVFSSQVNGGGFTPQVVMTDGVSFVSLSTAVGGTGALISGQQGDLQVGRSANAGFIFFGTSGGNNWIGLSGSNSWTFGGAGGANVVSFGSVTGETATLQSTAAGSPSGDSLTFKATTITLQAYSGASTVNCGVSNVTSCSFSLAGGSSGATTLIASATASGTVTLPIGPTTLAGLATIETFSAAQTFSNQIINTAARTIASATAATLDDVFIQAETTTITGNTGSPITALSKTHLGQPTLTDSSAVTVTTAATLTIDNAPAQAGSVTITNAYALNVAAGGSLFGGKVFMSGLTAGSGTKALCLNATANEVQTDTSATICGISALRYKNLIAEITPDQGLSLLSLRGESYRYKPGPLDDGKIHVSLIADEMGAMNHDCAEWSQNGVENYMDRCFEAYQVAYDKKLWEIIGKLTSRLPVNDSLRAELETLRR